MSALKHSDARAHCYQYYLHRDCHRPRACVWSTWRSELSRCDVTGGELGAGLSQMCKVDKERMSGLLPVAPQLLAVDDDADSWHDAADVPDRSPHDAEVEEESTSSAVIGCVGQRSESFRELSSHEDPAA